MTHPTHRGTALLAVAFATYIAARVLGTWELYLIALTFAAMTVVAWALVLAGSRRLAVERQAAPSEPLAGDPLEFAFTVTTGWRLRGLRVVIEGATGGAPGLPGTVVVEDTGLRAHRRVTAGPRPARRGIHLLPAFSAVVEDPLGLVRARRACGEPLRLTVLPRLEELASCSLCNDAGRHSGGGRRRATRDAWEFRGIRPHMPGEPLNRVDWKATAKKGALMLREMEADTDGDVTLLLDGRPMIVTPPAAPAEDGNRSEAAFETAVVAAGSVAAFILGSGHTASVFLPVGSWRESRLTPDAASRRRLLAALAEARPQGESRLGSSLPSILGGRDQDRRRPLVVVTSRVDEDLVHALVRLRGKGVPVSVVHVFEDGAQGRAGAAVPSDLAEVATLQAAGTRYVSVVAGGDVRTALRADSGRPAAMTRGRGGTRQTAGSRRAEAR